MRSFHAFMMGLLVCTLGACSGSDGNDNDNSNGESGLEPIIPSTTKMLTSVELDALESVSGDLSELVFSADTAGLASLESGDVVVCGVHGELLPYGLLRKVIGIERADGTVTVQTAQATLAEAVERGSINETFTLSADDIVVERSARGVVREASQLDDGIVFAINDYELYDADGNPLTRDDRVWVEGNFSFVPDMHFEIDIDGFEVDTMVFEIGSRQQSSIRVTAEREATFDEVEVLSEIELAPITFAIGPVPVVLLPLIQLRVGVDGTTTAELVAGVQTDATVEIGFGYQNGDFGPTSNFEAEADYDVPQFREGARGNARVWAGPYAELAAYGIAGVYGELRGFVRGDVDTTADPWWTLTAGVEALAGVFIEVFDATIAEYETPPLTESIELANAGGPAPTEEADIVTWARSFGGGENDNIEDTLAVISTSDGGSLIVGGTNSFTGAPSDAWIIKLDRLGQISWQTAFADFRLGIDAVPHPEGGYLILTGVVGTGADETHLIHLDDNGDVVWARRYEADKPLAGYGLESYDDHFIVAGVYGSGVNADFWAASVDGEGGVLWSKAIGGDAGEQVDGFVVNDDGSIVAVGPTNSFGVTNIGQWVVKFSDQGETIWQRRFDHTGSGNEWAHSVVAEDDGRYLVVGRTGNDALVTRLSNSGALLSAFSYDAESPYEEAFSALGTSDGGVLIAGNTGLGDDSDLWLLRLTPQLEVQWTTRYGGPAREEAGGTIQNAAVSRALAATEDGGFIVLSNTTSFGAEFYDAWIQRISDTGTITYDPGSDATRASLAGSFAEYELTGADTNETSSDVDLAISSVDIERYTPTPVVHTQATP